MSTAIYWLCFIFCRIFPRLPGLQRIYFFFTRGRNRMISKAELLGRLNFCGFRIIETFENNGVLYYIAQKVQTPSLDINPSFGPVIKLRRVGLHGKIIHLYKLRTMHPYSEYAQQYVHEKCELDDSGKFKDDFRVTGWGKVFRKMWIDELPQLVNFMRGEIGIVGVRALSEHYYSLYPKEVQELRIQTKPGLVPPYYADMPQNFDEIVASEKRYLEQKLKSPLKTDMVYFFKAFYNIVFKKARSG